MRAAHGVSCSFDCPHEQQPFSGFFEYVGSSPNDSSTEHAVSTTDEDGDTVVESDLITPLEALKLEDAEAFSGGVNEETAHTKYHRRQVSYTADDANGALHSAPEVPDLDVLHPDYYTQNVKPVVLEHVRMPTVPQRPLHPTTKRRYDNSSNRDANDEDDEADMPQRKKPRGATSEPMWKRVQGPPRRSGWRKL